MLVVVLHYPVVWKYEVQKLVLYSIHNTSLYNIHVLNNVPHFTFSKDIKIKLNSIFKDTGTSWSNCQEKSLLAETKELYFIRLYICPIFFSKKYYIKIIFSSKSKQKMSIEIILLLVIILHQLIFYDVTKLGLFT